MRYWNVNKLISTCKWSFLPALVFSLSCTPSLDLSQVNPGGNTVVTADSVKVGSTGEIKVFPGAQGFGTDTVAGRDGQICIVTNLEDDGEGSLRGCLERTGPRTVVFHVAGTIVVKEPIVIREPYLSVYGQTAPGDGILLRASLHSGESVIRVETHDVLLQYLRIRPGSAKHKTCCRDAVRIGAKDPGKVFNVVLDHNSFSWGTDQIVSVWFDSNNVTFSYNIISESLHDNGSNDDGPGGRGLLVGSEGAGSISIHHNYFAHSYQRNPKIVTSGTVDVVNNLVYHWVSRGGQISSDYEGQTSNWIGNVYVSLSGSKAQFEQGTSINWGDIEVLETNHDMTGTIYAKDNYGNARRFFWNPENSLFYKGYLIPVEKQSKWFVKNPFAAPFVTTVPAKQLAAKLLPVVGATLPIRDAVDHRVIKEYVDRSGKMPNCITEDDRPGEERCQNNVGGWPKYEYNGKIKDFDEDGIPDSWEMLIGSQPDRSDALDDHDSDGYTNVEEWAAAVR